VRNNPTHVDVVREMMTGAVKRAIRGVIIHSASCLKKSVSCEILWMMMSAIPIFFLVIFLSLSFGSRLYRFVIALYHLCLSLIHIIVPIIKVRANEGNSPPLVVTKKA